MARRCSARAVVQIFLTCLAIVTAITAFAFAFVFEKFLGQLDDNFTGNPRTTIRPCIRSTLASCPNSATDQCWDYCCPTGYFCEISPVVGLYCMDSECSTLDTNWCTDYADISQTCVTDVCLTHHMVLRVTSWSYILAAIGIFLDLVDIITIFTLPDAVVFKSGTNIFSSLVKWLAFGLVLGAGVQNFLSDLSAASCYNSDGMQLVADAGGMFVSYAIVQVLSAALSLVLSPLSAYYGGKLQGVPYVK